MLPDGKNAALLSNILELIGMANLESPLSRIELRVIRQLGKPHMNNITTVST